MHTSSTCLLAVFTDVDICEADAREDWKTLLKDCLRRIRYLIVWTNEQMAKEETLQLLHKSLTDAEILSNKYEKDVVEKIEDLEITTIKLQTRIWRYNWMSKQNLVYIAKKIKFYSILFLI